jgi:hypothetical protein
MRDPPGTDARPLVVGVPDPAADDSTGLPPDAGGAEAGAVEVAASALSGGGLMPGGRVNLGAGASAVTLARPTTARPVEDPLAALSAPSAVPDSAGVAEVPVDPDFACVSVIN